ncbi:WD40-repeat-containing domain protein [Geranomyces variabilis]|nr:WD40-repeat-containing domain protein [Geranomyces variabilis]KAJ3137488.1 hypothetical protein HDU90_001891 [Geranomyces variabilis]
MFAPPRRAPLLQPPRQKISKKRSRPPRDPDSAPAQLERVLGLTAARPAALALNPRFDTPVLAFPAGGVVVLYNYKRNRQTSFLSAPTGLEASSSSAPPTSSSARRGALSATKSVACLAYSADGQFLAVGEAGHQPRVIIYQEGIIVSELVGHKYGILALAFSPDNKFLVSLGYQHDGAVHLWNWRLGQIVATSRTSNKIACVAFDPQGNFFVTAGIRHMKFWYFDRERLLQAPQKLGRSEVMTLEGVFASIPDDRADKPNAFADVGCLRGADGETATYAITHEGTLMYFNHSRQMEKWVDMKVTAGRALHVTDKYIACGGSDGVLRLFKSSTLQYIMTFPKPHPLDVEPHTSLQTKSSAGCPGLLSVKIDPLNEQVACIYDDHSLYVWDIRDPKHVGKSRSFLWHSEAIWGVEMIPNQPAHPSSPSEDHAPRGLPQNTFATCSYDGTVRFWNLDGSSSAAPDADSLQQPAANTQRYFQHNIYSRELLRTMYFGREEPAIGIPSPTSSTGIRALRVSADGKYLATGDRVGNVRVCELSWFQEIRSFEAHDGEILTIDFSEDPDGRDFYMATASRDRCLHVYDGNRKFDVVTTLEDHTAAVTCVRFADAGKKLVSCGADKSLIFRQSAGRGGQEEWSSYHSAIGKSALNDMVLDPSSKYLATASHDRRINIFSIANGKAVRSYRQETLDESLGVSAPGDGSFHKIAIDPSGLYVAASASDKSIRIFEFFSGAYVGRIVTGHSELVTGVKFTLDCRRLVTTAADGCVFVWKIAARIVKQMRARIGYADSSIDDYEPAAVRKTSFASSMGAGARAGFHTRVAGVGGSSEPTTPTDDDFSPFAGSPRSAGFQYRETALPGWARSSASGRSDVDDSEITPTSQRFVAPRGRWAQRIGQDELVLFSAAPGKEEKGGNDEDDDNDDDDDDAPDNCSKPHDAYIPEQVRAAEPVQQDVSAALPGGDDAGELARLLEQSSTDLVIEDLDSLTGTSVDGSGSQSGVGDDDGDDEPDEQFKIYLPTDAEDADLISAAHVVRPQPSGGRDEQAGGTTLLGNTSSSSIGAAEETSFSSSLAYDDSFLSDLAKVVDDDASAAASSPVRSSQMSGEALVNAAIVVRQSLSTRHLAARATVSTASATTLLKALEVEHAPNDERGNATGAHDHPAEPADSGVPGESGSASLDPQHVGAADVPATPDNVASKRPSRDGQHAVGKDVPVVDIGGDAVQAQVASYDIASQSDAAQEAPPEPGRRTPEAAPQTRATTDESSQPQLGATRAPQPAVDTHTQNPNTAATGAGSGGFAPAVATASASSSPSADLDLKLFRALADRSAQRLIALASSLQSSEVSGNGSGPEKTDTRDRAALVESLSYVRNIADAALRDGGGDGRSSAAREDEASMLRMLERYSDVLVGLVRDKLKGE